MAKLLLWIVLAGFLAIAIYSLFGARAAPGHSNIADDENVVFFRTTGWLNEDTEEWHLPIHGWIYEPQDSRARRAIFERVLESRYDLTTDDDTEPNFARRLNLLIADNERGKRIVISIAGRTEVLPASEPNGHFSATLTLPAEELSAFGDGASLPFTAVTGDQEEREFGGEVRLVEPTGLSVISDIDDTVKVSHVTDRRQLLEKTFLLDFAEAPGMAETYRGWASRGASFHFVSSSPWQLYSPLTEFLDTTGFPWATLNLKLVRFRDETLFDLFKEGTETKPPIIRSILDRYPDRQFVLVGDSGEQDPEVYAELIRERPAQIQRVYIRNVTGEAPDNERFATIFDGIDPARWQLFETPDGLELPQMEAGM
ncbi:MAG: DUF2183 domain-containing protein [Woeseiaceae bacterium]|nr:DUF2183 domain-containing protein [Woeseiaceae bacterium]